MPRLGIVSDTHGHLRPSVLSRLHGCDLILHAGDVGNAEILDRLGELAPVVAVRGNVDYGPGLDSLPQSVAGELGGIAYRMTHRREDADPAWSKEARLVIFGHSHRPELEWRGECLWLNPGAIGPRRFRLPLTFALVTLEDGRLTPELRAVDIRQDPQQS